MLTSVVITALVLVFFAYLAMYKRQMIAKMFSLRTTEHATQFQQELEKTTSMIIKRLETEVAHLEFLLEEAEVKGKILEEQLKKAEKFLLTANLEKELSDIDTASSLPSQQEQLPIRIASARTAISAYQGTTLPISESPESQPAAETVPPLESLLNHEKRLPPPSGLPYKPPVSDDRKSLIFAMSDQGYNITEIAKATGMGKGEIMLLLQLNRK